MLRRLGEADIELVRVKRNSDRIRRNMFFQKEITPEMQRQWYYSVSNIYNYYFIIEHNGKKIGLINGKNVDYVNKTAEGGLFIWDEMYWGTPVAAYAALCLIDVSFLIIKLEHIYFQVRTENERVINFNKSLGYKLQTWQKDAGKAVYALAKADYFTHAEKIRAAAMKLCNETGPLSWHDIEIAKPSAGERLGLYSGLPDYLQVEINKKLSRADRKA